MPQNGVSFIDSHFPSQLKTRNIADFPFLKAVSLSHSALHTAADDSSENTGRERIHIITS